MALSLTLGAIAWSAALFMAPLALARGPSPTGAAAAILYTGAARICHQRPERSFHLAGVPLPVCSRCASLYVSGAAGALLAFLVLSRHGRPRMPRHARAILIVAALPTAATLALEFAGFAYPSSLVRAVSALPLGAAAGWVFIRSLRAEGPPAQLLDSEL